MRGGALGDFILGLPALRALRSAFPDAHLDLVAPRAVLPLAADLVDSTTPIELAENAPLFDQATPYTSLPEQYRDLDLAVIWLADSDGALRHNFERLGARQVLQAPALPPKDGHIHAVDHLLSTLEPLGIGINGMVAAPREDLEGEAPAEPSVPGARASRLRAPGVARGPVPRQSPVVVPNTDAVEGAAALLRDLGCSTEDRIVAIHPGSGGRWKCWPPERFARVIEAVTASGARPILVQGPADEEVVAAVRASITGGQPPVVANIPVQDLAAFLSLCAAYLGNDSGITHLAAAVGAPAVALFGPTDPAVWAPRGRDVTVIRGDGGQLEEIAVEQVTRALRSETRDSNL